MALTPLSVSISRNTSLFLSKKVLNPASSMASSLFCGSRRLSFCTTLALCISSGKFSVDIHLISFMFLIYTYKRVPPFSEIYFKYKKTTIDNNPDSGSYQSLLLHLRAYANKCQAHKFLTSYGQGIRYNSNNNNSNF